MAEAFKNLIGPATVQAVSHHLRRVHRRFDQAGFESQALTGLQALEFKARAQHLAQALMAHLPEDFDRCAGLLEASLVEAPVHPVQVVGHGLHRGRADQVLEGLGHRGSVRGENGFRPPATGAARRAGCRRAGGS